MNLLILKKESFKYYQQRFKNFLEMKEIISNKDLNAQLFLTLIGTSNYNMLAALLSSKTPP